MLKFFADENIAPRVIRALRAEGFPVISVHEADLISAPDEEILKAAQKANAIILTHDKDFGNLIRQLDQLHGGVILLRFRNQSPNNVIKHLIPFLRAVRGKNLQNRLTVMREGFAKSI